MTNLRGLLAEHGVADEDLARAAAYQKKFGGRLEQIAVNMGSLSTEALPEIYSRLLGVPYLNAAQVKG